MANFSYEEARELDKYKQTLPDAIRPLSDDERLYDGADPVLRRSIEEAVDGAYALGRAHNKLEAAYNKTLFDNLREQKIVVELKPLERKGWFRRLFG
jgi:hypothetical protein